MVLASSLGLLSSREFVRDLAWFAEQLVMTDMTPQFFDDADKLCAACRERPAFFAPDKVGADASEAAVAATRAAWAAMLPEWRRERRALFDERRKAKARGAREGGAKHLAWGDEGAHGGGRAQTTQDILRRHGLG